MASGTEFAAGQGSRSLVFLTVLCIATAWPPAAAQAAPAANVLGTDFQSWDELDVPTRLYPNLDVTWIARVSLSEELPNTARLVFATD